MSQGDLFVGEKPNTTQADNDQALLAKLFANSRLYHTSSQYKEFLDFVIRLRNVAPFNAMLLQIQKPGLRFVASQYDWLHTYNRIVTEGSRPLLIMRPFGPVALVYDIEDTDGEKLPEDVERAFRATGTMSEETLAILLRRLESKRIYAKSLPWGEGKAGLIRALKRSLNKKEKSRYEVQLNANHSPTVKFSTLVHELAHLYLGHLGNDVCLKIRDRSDRSHEEEEIEAESAAYMVCHRQGIKPNSENYLSNFLSGNTHVISPDAYAICKAAGSVEAALGIGSKMRFG